MLVRASSESAAVSMAEVGQAAAQVPQPMHSSGRATSSLPSRASAPVVQLSTQRWHWALRCRTLMHRAGFTVTASLSMAPSSASIDSRIPTILASSLMRSR